MTVQRGPASSGGARRYRFARSFTPILSGIVDVMAKRRSRIRRLDHTDAQGKNRRFALFRESQTIQNRGKVF
jgi:hypothetical protein